MAVEVRKDNEKITIEMDYATAEKMLAVIAHVRDDTIVSHGFDPWSDLCLAMEANGKVRYPSPLYKVDIFGHPLNRVWSINYKEKK